jgi:protein-S-isoprenylcysteine O-methyltransferase Ste14
MTTASEISDRTGPDSIKVGAWLFRHRTAIPLPIAAALLVVPRSPLSSRTLVVGGVVLTVAGELLRLWAVHHIGAISRTRSDRLGPLVVTGPFGICRNPLYIGNIAIWVGFALTAGLVWTAGVVLALLAAEYHAIVRWEEALVESRHGAAYRDYRARVARWIPGLGGEKRRGSDGSAPPDRLEAAPSAGRFSLRDTLFSERGTLIAIAVGFVLLSLKP